uniref:Uncharacterized protein n=1 Tax=Peromyscus maniculatus bairdii TaxID=230844 RepID=A0A8C8UAI5_PERMB
MLILIKTAEPLRFNVLYIALNYQMIDLLLKKEPKCHCMTFYCSSESCELWIVAKIIQNLP